VRRSETDRAGGPEGLAFANVRDVRAEATAIADVRLDLVSAVVDGEDDPPEALRGQVLDEQIEDRFSTDAHERLGRLSRQVAQTGAKSARHDEDGTALRRAG